MPKINKIAILSTSKIRSADETNRIIDWLENRGIRVFIPEGRCRNLERNHLSKTLDEIRSNSDLMLSLGGDGTLLRACNTISGTGIPLLGINLGNLGFLTEGSISDWEQILEKILEGTYTIEDRMMLECEIIRNEECIFRGTALNDAVIHHSGEMLLLKLSLKISGSYAGGYSADGIVVATPVGSTAYSMSAGGPIVNHRVECMILSAICPHTLSARPLVIPHDEILEISEHSNRQYKVCLDGHTTFKLKSGDTTIIRKARIPAKFVHIGKNFYTTIREKLKWFE